MDEISLMAQLFKADVPFKKSADIDDHFLLDDILARDEAGSLQEGIEEVLGDCYLIKNNPVYRWFRHKALSVGGKFSISDFEYVSSPLLSLDTIISTKNIPYIPNRASFSRLVKARPKYFTLKDVSVNAPRSNYLVHESAHLIADDLLRPFIVKGKKQWEIIVALIGEAFANSSDVLLHCGSAGDDIGAVFVRVNSYCRDANGQVRGIISDAISEIGLKSTLCFLLLGFLLTNFGYTFATQEHLRRVAKTFDLYFKESRVTFRLFEFTFKLNRLFVYGTSKLYFNANGHSGSMLEITDFCPFEFMDQNQSVKDCISRLVQFLGESMEGTMP